MNGKLEEKLAQLAFGDLSPSEAKRLEMEADRNPEVRRALMVYKDMRDGLRSLAEVPEDQFSKERLRDAILTQGLKPAPSKPVSSRTWLWMPAAACMLGFGLVYARHTLDNAKRTPEIVLNSRALNSVPQLISKEPVKVAITTPSVTQSNSGMVVAGMRITTETTSRHKRRHHQVATASVVKEANIWSPDEEFGAGVASTSADSNTSIPSETVSAVAVSNPIVLIDQDKDAQTGAQRATEVGSASNVLVGG